MITSMPVEYRQQPDQRYLSAELALLRALVRQALGEADESDGVEAGRRAVDEARAAMAVPPAIDRVVDAFGLTRFERRLLVLAVGVEIDVELAAVSGAARWRPGEAPATFALAQALWPEMPWEVVSPSGSLRRWHLIEMDPGAVVALSPLRVPERVLQYLAGVVEAQDPQLEPVLRSRGPSALMAEEHRATARRIAEAWDLSDRGWPVIQLCGDDRDGQEDIAAAVAADLGWGLSVVLGHDLPSIPEDRCTFARLWTRESLLVGAALYIDGHGPTQAETGAAVADAMDGPVLIGCHEPVRMRRASLWQPVAPPSQLEQRKLWQAALQPVDPKWEPSLAELASKVRLSARAIERSAPGVRSQLIAGEDPPIILRHVIAPSDHSLDDLAQRIEPVATWGDLVTTPQLKATLREIAAQVRHRPTVYERWGFASRGSRGLGITALFTGESGTGKTMAAEVLANDLLLDLYRIDLSAVVSKYIGETEKNLRRVFDAAEESGAILLFDEADALFGKRSEVKDSHDRYANIEVSYLLQRMEAYRGLAILTTNMKTALDRAFQRRLRFNVQFPFPDARSRERIWRGIFPRQTPLDQLDRKRLAQLSIAGGSIRSIAVSAAFRAAAGGGPVTMRHLQEATEAEFAKLDRPMTASELRGW
jgi:ATPase family associated with various cellular activities (AAA)